MLVWDDQRYAFNEIDLGPCYNCGGTGFVGVVNLYISDNTGEVNVGAYMGYSVRVDHVPGGVS